MEQVTKAQSESGTGAMGPKLVYVVGAGHCGSTLLSLALDRHSDVISVSEIVGLNARKSGYAGDQDFKKHHFWSRVAARYAKDFSGDFWSIPFSSPTNSSSISNGEWIKQNYQALCSIANTANVSIIFDASKQPRRLEVLLQKEDFDVRVIYLVRDARAVVHSYDRKYKSMWRGFRQIARLDRRARSIKRRFQSVPWITIRYEEMTDDFESTMKRICEFCEMQFESDMLRPDPTSFYGIGGNRLRHQPIREITADMTWVQDFPTWKKFLVGFLMQGYQLRFGYSQFLPTFLKGRLE